MFGSGGNGLRLSPQIVEEPVEGRPAGVVVLIVAEIRDEVLANFAG